jgi:hypothetical protein
MAQHRETEILPRRRKAPVISPDIAEELHMLAVLENQTAALPPR